VPYTRDKAGTRDKAELKFRRVEVEYGGYGKKDETARVPAKAYRDRWRVDQK
jgi:hypothetical protein